MLKTIGLKIWTVWCLLSFAILLLLMAPWLYLSVAIGSKRLRYWAHFVPHYICRVTLFLWGIRPHGQKLPPDTPLPAVFISNHRSYLDPLVVAAWIPFYFKFLGKAEVLTYPIIGTLVKHLYITVERNSKDSRQASKTAMLKAMQDQSASIFLCPEGTICTSKEKPLLDFHLGAFQLAWDAQRPIILMTYIGCADRMPRIHEYISPGPIHIHHEPPIWPHDFDSPEALRDYCWGRMAGRYV